MRQKDQRCAGYVASRVSNKCPFSDAALLHEPTNKVIISKHVHSWCESKQEAVENC